VLVEGGGTLLGGLFDQRLVDKVVAFVAPVIVGGVEAPSPVEGAGVEKVAQAMRLCGVNVEQVGQDIAITGYPQKA
jgi:diaminohydroxyphosphoribosylaminopyrimidine deaminase/5-amino-6-(5-phosphoribosylamino)uracil reductase